MKPFFGYDLGWPKLDLYYALTKRLITSSFGNDLQENSSLTRSDYGRMENQVSTALNDVEMWYFYVFFIINIHKSLRHITLTT